MVESGRKTGTVRAEERQKDGKVEKMVGFPLFWMHRSWAGFDKNPITYSSLPPDVPMGGWHGGRWKEGRRVWPFDRLQ